MKTINSGIVAAMLLSAMTEAAPATASASASASASVSVGGGVSVGNLLGNHLLYSTPCKLASGAVCGDGDLAAQAVALSRNHNGQSYGFDLTPLRNLYVLDRSVSALAQLLNFNATDTGDSCNVGMINGLYLFDNGCVPTQGSTSTTFNGAPPTPPSVSNPRGPTGSGQPTATRPVGIVPPSFTPLAIPNGGSNIINTLINSLTKGANNFKDTLTQILAKSKQLNNSQGNSNLPGGIVINNNASVSINGTVISPIACKNNLIQCLTKFNSTVANRTCASSGLFSSTACSESNMAKVASELARSYKAAAFGYLTNGTMHALRHNATQLALMLNATALLKSTGPSCKFFSLPLSNGKVSFNVFDTGCVTNPFSTPTTGTSTTRTTIASATSTTASSIMNGLTNGVASGLLSKLLKNGSILSAQICKSNTTSYCRLQELPTKAKAIALSNGAKAFGYTTDGKLLTFNTSTSNIAAQLNAKATVQSSTCVYLNLVVLRIFDTGCGGSTSTSVTSSGTSTATSSTITSTAPTSVSTSVDSGDSDSTTATTTDNATDNTVDTSTASDSPTTTTTEDDTTISATAFVDTSATASP